MHLIVRSSDLLGTQTLGCLVRLTCMSGPLAEPSSAQLIGNATNAIATNTIVSYGNSPVVGYFGCRQTTSRTESGQTVGPGNARLGNGVGPDTLEPSQSARLPISSNFTEGCTVMDAASHLDALPGGVTGILSRLNCSLRLLILVENLNCWICAHNLVMSQVSDRSSSLLVKAKFFEPSTTAIQHEQASLRQLTLFYFLMNYSSPYFPYPTLHLHTFTLKELVHLLSTCRSRENFSTCSTNANVSRLCQQLASLSQGLPASFSGVGISNLQPYELVLLAEFMLSLSLRANQLWEPVCKILALAATTAAVTTTSGGLSSSSSSSTAASGTALESHRGVADGQSASGGGAALGPSSEVEASATVAILELSLVSLVVMDRFLANFQALIIRCIEVESDRAANSDDTGQAREAMERLFACWSELADSVPPSSSCSNLKIETLHNMKSADPKIEYIRRLLIGLHSRVDALQFQLFQVYLASKLARPVGFRGAGGGRGFLGQTMEGLTVTEISALEVGVLAHFDAGDGAEEDRSEINLDLDEDDLVSYEDSLYVSGICGLTRPDLAVDLLTQLLYDRSCRLAAAASMVSAKVPFDSAPSTRPDFPIRILEDLHWLVLIAGHLLVIGPGSLSAFVRFTSPWAESDFSVSHWL
ncbi:unnamed protein product [Protopolystoma xenopodis]|uniref:Uncharacterized protein n=1 Tax=Protopolystoma xenopodis TaxID=117903 RepID=A0A448XEM0_9PLAT|nr:unnamed protein product [Protopolystoma xenopodis]